MEQSFIPVSNAIIDRKKNQFLLRHDVSRQTSTRVSYAHTTRKCEKNKRFEGVDHELGFKLTQKPKLVEDANSSLLSFLRPTKRETSISINKK